MILTYGHVFFYMVIKWLNVQDRLLAVKFGLQLCIDTTRYIDENQSSYTWLYKFYDGMVLFIPRGVLFQLSWLKDWKYL